MNSQSDWNQPNDDNWGQSKISDNPDNTVPIIGVRAELATTRTTPRVSVVMTVRDGEAFIDTSVRAALAMDYADLEVVVVDDGSTDRTPAILQAIDDSRLQYYPVSAMGRARALNLAVEKATGEFIAINDADDISMPQRLVQVMPLFETHPELDVIGTGYQTTSVFQPAPETGRQQARPAEPDVEAITPWRLYRNSPFVHSTVIYRKSLWQAIGGYDESLPMCIDYDFFLRAMAARGTGGLAKLNAQTVVYFDNPVSHFKRRSVMAYLRTNLTIRGRARAPLGLPVWARCLDVLQYYQAFRLQVKHTLQGQNQ